MKTEWKVMVGDKVYADRFNTEEDAICHMEEKYDTIVRIYYTLYDTPEIYVAEMSEEDFDDYWGHLWKQPRILTGVVNRGNNKNTF